MKHIPMVLAMSLLTMATTQASMAASTQTQNGAQSAISIERAIDIAKQRVNTQRSAQVVEIEYDRHYNNQNSEYEVKLVDGTTSYKLDINATTGLVTEFEQEALDNDDIAEYNMLTGTKLSLLQAIQFASSHLNGQVINAEFDVKNGNPIYEIEVIASGKKHDVDINANTAQAVINAD